MEYSVYDLIRILLKRWYVILLTMCIVGGLAMVLSQRSFEKVSEDYEALTTAPEPEISGKGSTKVQYDYTFEVQDFSKYTEKVKEKEEFYHGYLDNIGAGVFSDERRPNIYAEADAAFNQAYADVHSLFTNSLTFFNAQAALDDRKKEIVLSEHLTVEEPGDGIVCLTIGDLNEEDARIVADAYVDALTQVGMETFSIDLALKESYYEYHPVTKQDTSVSDLAQAVLKKPENAPNSIKAAATAAAFGFVLGCFGVLLATFIQDTHSKTPKKWVEPQKR